MRVYGCQQTTTMDTIQPPIRKRRQIQCDFDRFRFFCFWAESLCIYNYFYYLYYLKGCNIPYFCGLWGFYWGRFSVVKGTKSVLYWGRFSVVKC